MLMELSSKELYLINGGFDQDDFNFVAGVTVTVVCAMPPTPVSVALMGVAVVVMAGMYIDTKFSNN